jgi:hypothetical protein
VGSGKSVTTVTRSDTPRNSPPQRAAESVASPCRGVPATWTTAQRVVRSGSRGVLAAHLKFGLRVPGGTPFQSRAFTGSGGRPSLISGLVDSNRFSDHRPHPGHRAGPGPRRRAPNLEAVLGIPGGYLEPGESPRSACERESSKSSESGHARRRPAYPENGTQSNQNFAG